MRKSLVIAVLMNSIFATSVVAEQVTFLCYEPLAKHEGLYEMKPALLWIPTQLTFDTEKQTVTVDGKEDCSTILWSDPLIYFSCRSRNPERGLWISIGIFDRSTLRFALETISERSLQSKIPPESFGELSETRLTYGYDECERKGF